MIPERNKNWLDLGCGSLKLLKSIAHQTNKVILYTSHEIELAIQLCDKMLILDGDTNAFDQPCKLIENNSFVKDEIRIINNGQSNDERITLIDTDSNQLTVTNNVGDNDGNDNMIINLTNQIDYIFEIQTKEHDINSTFKSELI